MNMVIPTKTPYRGGKRILSTGPSGGPPPVTGLTLVAASYGTFTLTMSFDRAIDISSFDPTTIYVNDAERAMAMQGGGEYSLQDDNTIAMSMGEIGDYEGPDTVLQAGANSGIVAVDDHATWAGSAGTELPFS
jgi:hypothetical protein